MLSSSFSYYNFLPYVNAVKIFLSRLSKRFPPSCAARILLAFFSVKLTTNFPIVSQLGENYFWYTLLAETSFRIHWSFVIGLWWWPVHFFLLPPTGGLGWLGWLGFSFRAAGESYLWESPSAWEWWLWLCEWFSSCEWKSAAGETNWILGDFFLVGFRFLSMHLKY